MRWLLFVQICVLQSIHLWGYSRSTPDGTAMNTVGAFIQTHHAKTGELPSSWKELEQPIVSPDSLVRVEVTKRYAFLQAGARPKLPRNKGEIFLLSRRPFRNLTSREAIPQLLPGLRYTTLTEPLRYGLSILPSGTIRVVRLPEDEVQAMFRRQGLNLPAPDTLPERPWVLAVERRTRLTAITLFFSTATLGVGGGLMARRYIRRVNPKQTRPVSLKC